MKLTKERIISAFLTAALSVSVFSACSKNKNEASDKLSAEALKTAEYPLKTDETLSLWMRHHVGAAPANRPDYSKFPRMEELYKQTGVKLEISYADNGREDEQFNTLMASGNLPDMIYYDWQHITGGADVAIRSNYITALNDLIKDYCPNYSKILESDPVYAKMARTDSGNYYMFNGYQRTEKLRENDAERSASCGYTLRKDWLDELGMQPPETIDEWYAVLKAMKEKKNVSAPLTLNFSDEYAYQDLIGAYDTSSGFYQENGRVIYGRTQPQYKAFLEEMHKWYAEGLLDEQVMSNSDERVAEKMINGTAAASFTWIGAGIGRWIDAGRVLDDSYDLIGVKPPTLNKGDTSRFGNYFLPFPHIGIAISAESGKKELAAKFLDYGYSEDGAIMYNYGTEGESYEIKDGQPVYKEPENGMNHSDFLTIYTFSTGNWPYKVLTMQNDYFYTLPQQFQAVEAYKQTDYSNRILPPISHTLDESEEVSRLERIINNYADEMMKKFILGKEPLENFNSYIETMNSLGINRLTELKQNALDRYNRR